MINQGEFIKAAEKAFDIADFSHKLTHRIIATAAKRLIDYGFSYAEFETSTGRIVDNTKRAANAYVFQMEKIVSDLLGDTTNISKTTAKDNLGKIPDDDWDEAAFIASLMYGDTYKQRVKKYTQSFKNEIESFVKVGQEEKMTGRWYLTLAWRN